MTKQRGFTVIEMCLLICIGGILLVMVISAYDIYKNRQPSDTTWSNEDYIRNSMTEYQFTLGNYPCPASLALASTNANYGIADCAAAQVPLNTCANGFCRVQSNRDADGIGGNDIILIGMVPFISMDQATIPGSNPPQQVLSQTRLSANHVIDGWDDKILYAVSENLTDSAAATNGFRSDIGVIDMVDENNNSVLATPDSVQYALVSFGANKAGAYPRNGAAIAIPCLAGATESPNCAANGTSRFISGLYSVGTAAQYYDDIVMFVEWTATNMWSYSPISPGNIYNTRLGRVGVGVQVPSQSMEIGGDLKAIKTYTSQFCDSLGQNCYDPEKIGGTDPNMNCGGMANAAIKQIGVHASGVNGNIDVTVPSAGCQTIFANPATLNLTCPGSRYLSGFKSDNTATCCNSPTDCITVP